MGPLHVAGAHGERDMAKFKYGDLDHFPKVLAHEGMKLVIGLELRVCMEQEPFAQI